MAIRNIRAKIFAILLAVLVCFGVVTGGQGNLSAYASTDIQTAYENTDVLENLEGATIGGKTFNLADYPHNSDGKPQMISYQRQAHVSLSHPYIYRISTAYLA